MSWNLCADTSASSACRYEFETRVAQKCIQFESMTFEDKQLIVVSGVRGPVYEAGIRPGDQLTGISDTNRDTVWTLDDMASLRFVYLCMNMRIPNTITLAVRKNAELDRALRTHSQSHQRDYPFLNHVFLGYMHYCCNCNNCRC
jgi:C-terminal processing protease CtpA/Prc